MVRSPSSWRQPSLLLPLVLICLNLSAFNIVPVVQSAPVPDLIDSLPGYGTPPTRQYSGFLNATDGCDVDANGICMLHYWFIEAEGDKADEKPVLLWLNGGPGTSAIMGLLQELGPLLMNATGDGLTVNPWSWNTLAHLLVIEAPVGVGYSYCGTQLANRGVCKNTDRYTASANRVALVDFFTHKFPELAPNGLYIAGESYAGVYIPTLAKELLDDPAVRAAGVRLRGLAVGDPCTDAVAQADSMDPLWYGHKYGLVEEAEFQMLWHTCGARYPAFGDGNGTRLELGLRLGRERIRFESEHGGSGQQTKEHRALLRTEIGSVLHSHLFRNGGNTGPTLPANDPRCLMAHRKFLLSTSHALSQTWADQWLNDLTLFGGISPSPYADGMTTWMQRTDVRAALHATHVPSTTWPTPPQGFDYTSEYAACNAGYPEGTPSMVDFYREIAPRLEETLVYNGDTDPCVSYEGTALAIARVGFRQVDGGGQRPWFYNRTGVEERVLVERSKWFGPDLLLVGAGAQFGGQVVNYEHNLTFITVHGSGHMVPQFRPQAALHMLKKVLEGQEFSPLMPSNHTLQTMSDTEFETTLSAWTKAAKSTPYVTDA